MHRSLNKAALAIALSLSPVMHMAMAAEPQPIRASADQPSATPGGTTFILPEGWSRQVQGNATEVMPPEVDGSRVVFVDSNIATPDEAVAAVWEMLNLSPKLKVATNETAEDGWEEFRYYDYDLPEAAKRIMFAWAMRQGSRWTVVAADVSSDTGDRRGSQLNKLLGRVEPAGHQRESFAGRKAHRLDAARLQTIVDFVEAMRRDWNVPGVAIGIVQHGKVVMSRGFGVRELGKPQPVDGDTRFMIASNTKALTTLMLAKLVEAGKLEWDARAVDVYPAFRLGDDATTGKVLIKHLVCACTGVPRQDMEWLLEGENSTPLSAMQSLAGMQPTTGFGEFFQYSNPMAAAAGFIGGQVFAPRTELGKGYDEAMQALVFRPLDMQDTTFDYSRAQQGNFATPHKEDVDLKVHVVSMRSNETIIPIRPAGAAWSTVNDLLKYVRMELAGGKLPDGTRYISEAALKQRLMPQIATGADSHYAMGLAVDTTDGTARIAHGGNMIGFRSNMMWWPEHGVGAVILTNSDDGADLRAPFQRRLEELLFDGKPLAAARHEAALQAEREYFAAERKLWQRPPDPAAIAGLAARYRNDVLGDIIVTRQGPDAWFDFGTFKSRVATKPQPDGSLAFVMADPEFLGMPFIRADKDDKRRLRLMESQREYLFDEVD